MLAEEEASTAVKVAKAPKAGAKKAAPKPAGPGAIAAGGGLGSPPAEKEKAPEEPESFSATGIDNALDLLETVTAKMDKASIGQQAAGLERHPEVRLVRFCKHAYISHIPCSDVSKRHLRHIKSASCQTPKPMCVSLTFCLRVFNDRHALAPWFAAAAI